LTQLTLKDLKEVARGILEQGTAEKPPKIFYSELLGETYRRAENGDIVFNGGIFYTPRETGLLKGLHSNTIRGLHAIKSIFTGSIITK